MDEKLVEKIKLEMSLRDTEGLIEIWKPHDLNEWTEEAFEAIRQILLTRLDQLPYQDNQDEADVHMDRIQPYLDSGQLDQALTEADLAVQSAPHFGETHLARGMVLEELGRFSEAILAYEKALQLDDSLWEARKYSRDLIAEEKKEQHASQFKPRFDYGGIFKTAWTLMWKDKLIWVATTIMPILGLLRLFPFPAQLQPQTVAGRALLSCLDIPIELFLTYASLALDAFIFLLFYRLNTHTQQSGRELWTIARKSAFRLAGFYIIQFLVVTIPIFFLLVIGYIFFSTYPAITYVAIVCIFGLFILFGFLVWMLEIELIIHLDPFIGNIKRGLSRIFHNFGPIFVISLLFDVTGTIQFCLFLVLPVVFSHIPLHADINTIKAVSEILNNFSIQIPSLFFGTLMSVLVRSVMVTLYCKISEPYIDQNQFVDVMPTLSDMV